LIGKTKWYLGGSPNYDQTASSFYRFERGTSVSSSEHPSYWIGDVGLIYPSDFGYAGGSNSCLSSVLNSKLCISWVALNSWTITQRTAYSYVFYIFRTGYLNNGSNAIVYDVNMHPTIYLKSNVIITSGDGSSSDPYQLDI